jgi:putative FmdB family regulatory protein
VPIYEYHCDDCGCDFEELLFTTAQQADVQCKSCSSANIVKLMSGAAVRSGSTPVCADSCESYKPQRGGGCCGGMCSGH